MPTAKKPHVFKPKADAPSQMEIDEKQSENYRIMEAYGWPRVVYAIKANKYFRDMSCEKEFDAAEIEKMGLPQTVNIRKEREKLVKEAMDKDPSNVDMQKIYEVTSPKRLLPPEHIRERLSAYKDGAKEERLIGRLNRATYGKA